MKTSLIIFLASILASSFLSADRIVKTNNPVAKVIVADEIIDKDDTAAQKVVKAKVVQGDQRKKRRIKREVR